MQKRTGNPFDTYDLSICPEGGAPTRRRLKVEINTREHENLFGLHDYPFRVDNPWFTGQANVTSFAAEELFGTKLRALLQRRKSRDLFDLSEGLLQLNLDLDKMIQCFDHYLNLEGTLISRAAAEQRLLERFERSLTEDIAALLPRGHPSRMSTQSTPLVVCGFGCLPD